MPHIGSAVTVYSTCRGTHGYGSFIFSITLAKPFFLLFVQQPPVGQDLLIHKVSRSHTMRHSW